MMKLHLKEKRKRIGKIILLFLANSILTLFCVFTYQMGYGVDVTIMGLQFVFIWLHYHYIHTTWKMLVMDGVSMLFSATGLWYAHRQYQQNISGDAEGVMVFQLFFLLWAVFSLFAILFAALLSFDRRGCKIKRNITCGILLSGIAVFGLYSYLSVVPFAYEYVDVFYDCPGIVAQNEQYIGRIDYNTIEICTLAGKEVTTISDAEKEIALDQPEQIALGEKYYYVLGNGIIVKLDYQSQVIARRKVGQACSLTCKNGYLFIETADNEDGEPRSIVEGFHANKYVKEDEFETGKIMSLKADLSGRCKVAGILFYEHNYRCFSTNPNIKGCEETNSYIVSKEEGLLEREKTTWTELVEKMLTEKQLDGLSCRIEEYQKGNYLYGVVNIQENFLGFADKKLKGSIAYRISCGEKKIEILKELKGRYMMLATDEYVICQDEKELLRIHTVSDREEKLAKISDSVYESFDINGDYIISYEGGETAYVRWKK